MKIGVVVKDFISQRGGVERFAWQFVAQSQERGHEVHVLANRWNREEEGRFTLHRVPALRWPSLAKLISFPLMADRLLRGLAPFDIVFGLTPLFSLDVYRLGEGLHREVLQRRYRSSLTRAWKRLGFKSQFLLWMEKRMFSPGHFRRVITISEASRRQLIGYYQIPQEQVITIYNGVDLQRFNPTVREAHRGAARRKWEIEEEEMAVLFVGNDFRRKGLMSLLQAIGLLHRRGMRVKGLVAGRGSPRPFAQLIRGLGIEGRILFLGGIDQVEEAYAGADLFVLPSYYDPFGYACLEALACGLPVITTQYAGASEIIEEGKNGRVIPSPEPDSLAEAITTIYQEGAWGRVNQSSWESARAHPADRNTEAILSLFSRLRGAS